MDGAAGEMENFLQSGMAGTEAGCDAELAYTRMEN